MEPEIGEMYVRDRARFEALARRWTWRYAMHDILPYWKYTIESTLDWEMLPLDSTPLWQATLLWEKSSLIIQVWYFRDFGDECVILLLFSRVVTTDELDVLEAKPSQQLFRFFE